MPEEDNDQDTKYCHRSTITGTSLSIALIASVTEEDFDLETGSPRTLDPEQWISDYKTVETPQAISSLRDSSYRTSLNDVRFLIACVLGLGGAISDLQGLKARKCGLCSWQVTWHGFA